MFVSHHPRVAWFLCCPKSPLVFSSRQTWLTTRRLPWTVQRWSSDDLLCCEDRGRYLGKWLGLWTVPWNYTMAACYRYRCLKPREGRCFDKDHTSLLFWKMYLIQVLLLWRTLKSEDRHETDVFWYLQLLWEKANTMKGGKVGNTSFRNIRNFIKS